MSKSIFDTGLVKVETVPGQKMFHGKALPLVIVNNKASMTVDEMVALVSGHDAELEHLMNEHGAILFRGFPTPSANEFSRFVRAFKNWADLPYEESLSYAVRLPVTERVCTTNEGKTGGMIWHHEQAQAPKYPLKLFFYCEKAADHGGATGISHSIHLLEKLTEKYPDWVRSLEEKQLLYHSVLPADADLASGQIGRSWKSFFSKSTKEEAEKRAKELGYSVTWRSDDALVTVTPKLPGIRVAPGTNGKKSFFNQMLAQYLSNRREWVKNGNSEASFNLDQFLTFADGSSIPTEPLEFAAKVSDEIAVDLEWKQGDIGLLDNYVVMHARRAFDGSRKIYASLAV